jgi:hypothetical protein
MIVFTFVDSFSIAAIPPKQVVAWTQMTGQG